MASPVPQPTLAQLGAAIRELREARALTIEGLAEEAKLHTVSISRIEAGGQNPTWTALSGIASALDVEIVDLVRRATDQAAQEG